MTKSASRAPASGVPTPDGLPVSAANPEFLSLTHLDQRFADNGNQFSAEPPDQGFAIEGTTQCVGGPCIVAAVNSAIEIVGNTIVYGQPPLARQPNIPVGHMCSPNLFMLVGCGLLDGTSETIPCQELNGPGNGCFRSALANWGTLVAKITP